MAKTAMLCAAMACAMVAESSEAPSLMTPAHDGKSFKVPWQDESVSSINRLPARSAVRPCSKDGREYVLSLDGEWDFEWKNGDERRKGKINVPGCWQLQGEYDPPQYTNMTYPFAFDPPNVESEPPAGWTSHRFRNPHGIYRRSFRVPAEWRGRDVTLRLNGYSSAVLVRMNGRDVGYGEDGRLPSEWNLTPYLIEGDNALEVEVLKFSDGSYLEDQDFWRLSGLFRSVELVGEAKGGLRDFSVAAELSDDYSRAEVSVSADGCADYEWEIYSPGGILVGAAKGGQKITVASPRLWKGGEGVLYKAILKAKGDVFERRFGMRRVSIEDGVLKVNGERIVIHGVDRHEMSPYGGYAMTKPEMERDIAVMKEYGINAVRTSHYPNDSYWYDLCDENGIFVVAEANVECHGSGHPLGTETMSHRSSWRDAIVERNLRQVAVLKDHPSIIVWSLGNENGKGQNMVDAYHAVKAADPTRPVQYEGVLNPYHEQKFDVEGTDIICPMYEHPDSIRAARLRYRLLPYIYALARDTHETGRPIMRPVWLDYPESAGAADEQKSFTFGPYLFSAVIDEPMYSSHRAVQAGLVPARLLSTPDGKPGVKVEYFRGQAFDEKASETVDAQVNYTWPGPPLIEWPDGLTGGDNFSCRITGRLTLPDKGVYELGVEADDGFALWIDGQEKFRDWRKTAARGVSAALGVATFFIGRPDSVEGQG